MDVGSTEAPRYLHLDVYGVAVRFSSTEPHHYTQLGEDYDIFGCEPQPTYDIDFAVERCPHPHTGSTTIIGSLGDHIDVDGATVRLRGPRVGESSAYPVELRGYFTASILRQLVERERIQQVHASVVDSAAGAVVFAGAKKSGKTSLALLSVATGRAYKSNDISFLRVSKQTGAVEAFGLPQAFTVGLGAQDWFARNLPHVGLTVTQAALRASDLYLLEVGEKIELKRQDIAKFARVDATPTRLGAVVFPEPNMQIDKARIRRLSDHEAGIRLAMLAEHHLRWGLPPLITVDRYLEQLTTVITTALAQAPCFQMQWCADHNSNLEVLEREVFAVRPHGLTQQRVTHRGAGSTTLPGRLTDMAAHDR